ncbi:MAG: ribosome maturation factor RimP [Deltaproteobacteria bacterium]|nr:ribosome maturation factor RimP [Deltaproteobacteria bacterium]
MGVCIKAGIARFLFIKAMDSIFKSEPEQKLIELCESTLHEHGYHIVDLDCMVTGNGLVRIFIDFCDLEHSRAVSHADCATVTRLLDPLIESSDLFCGKYNLEVSSPGLDRRLRKSSDFERFAGNHVKVRLVQKEETLGKEFTAELLGNRENDVLFKLPDREVCVPIAKIKRASLVMTGQPQLKRGSL